MINYQPQKPEDYFDTGSELSRTRLVLGVSRRKLASRVGCRHEYIARWESTGDEKLNLSTPYRAKLISALRSLCMERIVFAQLEHVDIDILAGSDLGEVLHVFAPDSLPE